MGFHLKCILVLVLIQSLFNAQSKLVFQQVKDTNTSYTLLLGKYPVQLKLKDSVPFKVIIDDFHDSILNVRFYKKSSSIDSAVMKINNDYVQLLKTSRKKQRDSLKADLDTKVLQARYSTIGSVNVARIKTVTIYNHYFSGKRKQIKLANAACIVFIAGTLLTASTQNPIYIGTGIGLTAISFIAKSIVSTRDLDLIIPKKAKFRKKWRIVKVI